jgi:general stress protein 26
MENVKNLHGEDAINRLKEMAKEIRVCLFSTNHTDHGARTRPMQTQNVDDEGNIWFFSGKSSDKNIELTQNSLAELYFSDPSNNRYLIVTGKAEIISDRAEIEKQWNPIVKAWFEQGKDDPDLSLIKVRPKKAHYWDNKSGKMIQFLKIAASAVTGKTMDDSIEGDIDFGRRKTG